MKHFSVISIISALLLMISACGPDQQKKNQIELRYYMWGTPTVANMHRQILDLFEQEHPGVTVKLEVSNWGAYWDKLQVQLASNSAPDVYWMSGAYFYNFVNESLFLNLAPFMTRDSIKLEHYFQESFAIQSATEVLGLAKDMTAVVLYYNKTMFDEAGLAYPDSSWDWNDLLTAATALTKDKNGDGLIDQWGTAAFLPYVEEYVGPMVFSNGGMVLNEAGTKCLLDQPAAMAAVQFMVDLLKKHEVCVLPSQTGSVGGDPFMTGQVAMIQNISALVPEYLKAKNFTWGIAPIPKSPYTKKRVTTWGTLVHVASAGTKYPELSWELIKFFSEEKAQTILAANKIFVPSLKSVAQRIFAVEPPEHIGEIIHAASYAHDLQYTKNWLEWNNAIQRELEPAFLGNKTVPDAIAAAVKAVDNILEK